MKDINTFGLVLFFVGIFGLSMNIVRYIVHKEMTFWLLFFVLMVIIGTYFFMKIEFEELEAKENGNNK